jgi:hypothetical protein
MASETQKPAAAIAPQQLAPSFAAALSDRPTVQKCKGREEPYRAGGGGIEEGAKMVSNLVSGKPHELRCGMPVEIAFNRYKQEAALPEFRPRAAPRSASH